MILVPQNEFEKNCLIKFNKIKANNPIAPKLDEQINEKVKM